MTITMVFQDIWNTILEINEDLFNSQVSAVFIVNNAKECQRVRNKQVGSFQLFLPDP